jgi:hypothetical protein
MSAKLYSRDALLKRSALARHHMPPSARLLVEQPHASKRHIDKKERLDLCPTALGELPFVDAFRTICLTPTPEMKAFFEDVQHPALSG